MERAIERLMKQRRPTESQIGLLQAFPEPSLRWLRINA
jgi:hypothetical protein